MFKVFSFLPEIYFFISITIIFLFCIVYNLSSVLKFPSMYKISIYFSIMSLLYTFFLFLNNSMYYSDYSILFKNESSILFSELLILITIVIFITSLNYNYLLNLNSFEYIVFILISLGSFFIFSNIMNIIFIYIILELQSILISILISLNKYNRYSIEASIKYFILGSFSSLLLLYGFSIIYGSTGLLSLYEISLLFEYFEYIENALVLFSIKASSIFILVGLLFKIYSAPLHFWLPDIYEGTPTSVLVYISTVQLLVMVFFFLKIYYYLLFDFIKFKQFVVFVISILTLLFGSFGALVQRKVKKLISFSALTMNGFFLYSLVNNNVFLLETSITYLFIYVFTMLLLFSIIQNVFFNTLKGIIYISDFFKFYSYNNSLSLILCVLFFSVSGIPPFIGFISKLFWIKSLVMEYNIFIFILVFVFLIVSFYYIRLIKNIYTLSSFSYNLSINSFNYLSSVVASFLLFSLAIYLFVNHNVVWFIKLLLHSFFLCF